MSDVSLQLETANFDSQFYPSSTVLLIFVLKSYWFYFFFYLSSTLYHLNYKFKPECTQPYFLETFTRKMSQIITKQFEKEKKKVKNKINIDLICFDSVDIL